MTLEDFKLKTPNQHKEALQQAIKNPETFWAEIANTFERDCRIRPGPGPTTHGEGAGEVEFRWNSERKKVHTFNLS